MFSFFMHRLYALWFHNEVAQHGCTFGSVYFLYHSRVDSALLNIRRVFGILSRGKNAKQWGYAK